MNNYSRIPMLLTVISCVGIAPAHGSEGKSADKNPYTVYPYYDDFVSPDAELKITYSTQIDSAAAIFVGRVSSVQTRLPTLSLANRCFVKFDSIQWLKQPASYPAENFSEIAYYPYRKPDDASALKDFNDAKNCPLKAGVQYLVFAKFDSIAPDGLNHLHIDMRAGTTQPYEDAQHKILAIQSHPKT